ncbi:disulfide bond formation protein B [Microbulbifer sp. OS29]|uniref:Disulfide bond formation protein B n=1 Tax=Microbulbifer okhotskensis TaxID=2926617 RepID=A0A9X2EK83_9GAMM|nr:disulfide bond formation protein B [Microbulbifer okhotskensis]MCO1333754.1 disulfide bond formation protein B [Microbulbifer okhotskensis]
MDGTFRNLNALGMVIICGVLALTEYFQLIGGEMPCPLCLLQRAGLVGVLFGLLLNLIYGPRPQHYSLAMLAALLGAATALRQISLHVIPGTPGYGGPLMGYHYYTWAFLLFCLIITGIAIISAFEKQYKKPTFISFRNQSQPGKTAIVITFAIVATNILVTFAECGPSICPDNPDDYWLFGFYRTL